MKRRSISRILGVVVTLALLLLAIPGSSILAAGENLTLDIDEGEVGDQVEVTGASFSSSIETYIVFSSENADIGDKIGDDVNAFELIGSTIASAYNTFSVDCTIPDELTDGDDNELVHGGTYYMYAMYYNVLLTAWDIVAKEIFTVIGFSDINIDTDEGPVDIEVEITGEGFVPGEDITIEYDDDDVTSDIDGDDVVDGSGNIEFMLAIPESIAGDHTITVSDETGNKAEVTFTVETSLEMSEIEGPPGTVIIVNGTGFGYREDFYSVRFGTLNILTDIDQDRTDRDGSFTFTYTVPATLGTGTYTLSVEDDDGNEAEGTFTIAITSDIDKTTGSVGETLTITGTGFTTGTTVVVTYDGNPVTLNASNIDTSGNLTAQFSAPESAAGAHNIVLTVGAYSDSFVFTMESVAPGVPQLSLPLTGEKAKQPITFDWGDITDDSGVTYTLWISNDSGFTTTVLERSGLTDSSYTMTEAEELASVSKDTPYYWSVRAVDNAGNVGAWATAATFTTGFNFNWPTWAWWVVGGISAVFLILLFFWMGRRSITY